jgi:hypothetical protein
MQGRMRSFPHFGALLTVATLIAAPVVVPVAAQESSQNSASESAKSSARVQHVTVRGTGDNVEVEIQTSGAPVSPDTQVITGPDRIVVDFPGALPAADLHALKINRGPLKGIRSGLFFDNPPITRIVLDLAEPQSYKILTTQNMIVVKLGPALAPEAEPQPVAAEHTAKLKNSSLATTPVSNTTAAPRQVLNAASNVVSNIVSKSVSNTVSNVAAKAVANTTQPLAPVAEEPPPPPPPTPVTVTFANGLLRIHADKATLSQVLFEVQRQTQAEIAIPAGAEQEMVVADVGPAPAREVLSSLLNGSRYNFIFVGNESSLERVILTRRDPNNF